MSIKFEMLNRARQGISWFIQRSVNFVSNGLTTELDRVTLSSQLENFLHNADATLQSNKDHSNFASHRLTLQGCFK